MKSWRNDEVYRKRAKKEGYRSRAAFKLLEIEERFRIFTNARRIVDLCSAPGSWLQVARELCNHPDTIIVGVDVAQIQPIPNTLIIQSPIDSPDIVTRIFNLLKQPAHVVLSDCSPKLTGNRNLDRERQLWQATRSLELALKLLVEDGNFVAKVFQSGETKELISKVQQSFKYVKTFKPKSSFQRSPEMYLIAKGFRGD